LKIELISPAWKDDLWEEKSTKSIFPPLSLTAVAAVTPKDIPVKITDESVQTVDCDNIDADLVGISVMTALAPRAYAMADRLRKQGISVVLGGIHPTAVPGEAKKHADTVVIGEAENTWPRLVEDFRNGTLEPFYSSKERPEMADVPTPRNDLVNPDNYLIYNSLQTTRGCPYSCSFCAVSRFFGRTYRFRPVEAVIQDVKMLSGKSGKYVAFVDDNIVGNRRHAKELFRGLMPLGIKWISQASIDFAEDPELVAMAADSGCIGMFIGFESLSEDNLAAVGKSKVNKVEKYEEAIAKLHAKGISIEGAFVFGLDGDDESVFEKTVDFTIRTRLEAAQFGVLTPFPGTQLYRRLTEENRIFDPDWSKYSISRVVYHPKKMSPAVLQEGFNWAWKDFYSLKSIVSRLGLRTNPFIWALNWNIRRRVDSFLERQQKPGVNVLQHQPT